MATHSRQHHLEATTGLLSCCLAKVLMLMPKKECMVTHSRQHHLKATTGLLSCCLAKVLISMPKESLATHSR